MKLIETHWNSAHLAYGIRTAYVAIWPDSGVQKTSVQGTCSSLAQAFSWMSQPQSLPLHSNCSVLLCSWIVIEQFLNGSDRSWIAIVSGWPELNNLSMLWGGEGAGHKSVIARIASSLQTGVFQFALSRKLSRGTWSCRWEGSLPPLCHVQQIHTAWKTIWSFWSICSLFSEVQPSTSEPEGFLPIPGQCCWYKHGLLLGGKGWQLYSVTNGNPWRMETHCTQKSQNFCISTAEPVVTRGIYQGFGLLWGVLLLILPIPQHKIPDYSRKVNDIPQFYMYHHVSIHGDLKVLVRIFNCESRACYVGNPRESFFSEFAKVTCFFAKVSRKLDIIIIM